MTSMSNTLAARRFENELRRGDRAARISPPQLHDRLRAHGGPAGTRGARHRRRKCWTVRRDSRLSVVALSPYVADYIELHPDLPLCALSWRATATLGACAPPTQHQAEAAAP